MEVQSGAEIVEQFSTASSPKESDEEMKTDSEKKVEVSEKDVGDEQIMEEEEIKIDPKLPVDKVVETIDGKDQVDGTEKLPTLPVKVAEQQEAVVEIAATPTEPAENIKEEDTNVAKSVDSENDNNQKQVETNEIVIDHQDIKEVQEPECEESDKNEKEQNTEEVVAEIQNPATPEGNADIEMQDILNEINETEIEIETQQKETETEENKEEISLRASDDKIVVEAITHNEIAEAVVKKPEKVVQEPSEKAEEIETVSLDDDDDDEDDGRVDENDQYDYDEDDDEDYDEIHEELANVDSEPENVDDSEEENVAPNKMDLSTDEEDYNDEEEFEEDDEVVEIVEKEVPVQKVKPTSSKMEDVKGSSPKIKFKSYPQKMLSTLKKRSIKILNKTKKENKMPVMEDADVLECDTKIMNLTANININIKDNDTKEILIKKKNDENKENLVTAEKPTKLEKKELKIVKSLDDDDDEDDEDDDNGEEIEDDVNEIDDIIESEANRNRNEEDFNEEFAFQMDVDDNDDEEIVEEEEEEAVDLSSSFETKTEENKEDEAIELSDSSPEKSVHNLKISIVEENVKRDILKTIEKDTPVAVKQQEIKEKAVEKKEEKAVSEKADKKFVENSPINSSPSVEIEKETVKDDETKRKRSRSTDDDDEPIIPSKKLKNELDSNYQTHDKLLKDYIETTSNNTVDDIQKHADSLVVEIQTLNEMIRAKEVEWNNMLHLKKVKEEILLRLTRKRNVMDIMSTKLGEVAEYSVFDSPNQVQKRFSCSAPGSVVMNTSSSTPLSNKKDFPNNSNSSLTSMVPLSSSTNTILQSRANMKSSDVAKEKPNTVQLQRQILPKPVLTNHQQILNNLAMSAGLTSSSATTSTFTGMSQNSLVNGHHNPNQPLQVGRQGVIKDVKSIIADYRQKHPEAVPRRGRRMKNIGNSNYNDVSSSRNLRSSTDSRVSELGLLLSAVDGNSRPSSNDSSHSNSNNLASSTTNLSFKDVLVQFAKMSQNERQMLGSTAQSLLSNMNNGSSSGTQAAATNLTKPSYPEVTLHPVLNSSASSDVNLSTQSNNSSSNSLLHGILTKSAARPSTGFTSFSPTLARLLTAPERLSSQAAVTATGATPNQLPQQSPQSSGINLSKSHSEITITPVVASNIQQSLMQQQQALQKQQQQLQYLQQQQQQLMKTEHYMNMDDEADDSVDRLVIDEGEDHQQHAPNVVIATAAQEFHENEVPECQGCKKREAQFVCAGCGNQWYCSRECQVGAWDEHSEICTG